MNPQINASSIADTFDFSKMWDMSHFFKLDLRLKVIKRANLHPTYHKINKKYYLCILYDMLRI